MNSLENSNKQKTNKDIAKYANVSTATVSRVINNKGCVSEETKVKVLGIIKALNYQPSRTAQRLRAKRSQLIGLIIPDIENPFFTSVVRGIEDIAYQSDFSIVLCNSDEDIDKEKLYIDVMCSEGMAGVIITAISENNIFVQRLFDKNIAIVAMDRPIAYEYVDNVAVNNEFGAFEAVVHLIQLGHRNIGFVGHPSHISTGIERKNGYLLAHRENGFTIQNQYLCEGDAKQKGGFDCTLKLLKSNPEITALFVTNNLMTLGALGAIRELGLRIPEDISLIGFDDMPWAQYLNPPLTAVAQPTYDLGKKSAELLLQRIKDPNRPANRVQLKTSLIIRSSTIAPNKNRIQRQLL